MRRVFMKSTIRRACALCLCLWMLAVTLLPSAAVISTSELPELPDTSVAKSVLLYNIDSDTLMYRENADVQLYPAATVKLMVALLAHEKLADRMDEKITIPKEVVNKASGVLMPLKAGETISIRNLFYGLLVSGANDAAIALALESYGSLDLFVAAMNARAKDLGMTDTVYVNVTGIDHFSQHTTVNDLLQLCLAVYKDEFIQETVSLVTVNLPATNLHAAKKLYTRNYLLSRLTYPYYIMNEATGLNYGETQMAGNCTCATAVLGNVRYLCIVMGGVKEESEWNGETVTVLRSLTLARALLRWGSKAFEYRTVISPQMVCGELPVELANGNDYVTAVPSGTLEIFVRRDVKTAEAVAVTATLSTDRLTAPVEEGQPVGQVEVRDRSGKLLGKTELVTKNALNLSRFKYWQAQISQLLNTKVFKICTVLFLLGILAGVLITARVRYLRQARIALRRQSK